MRSSRSRRMRSASHPAGSPLATQKMPNTPSAMPTICGRTIVSRQRAWLAPQHADDQSSAAAVVHSHRRAAT